MTTNKIVTKGMGRGQLLPLLGYTTSVIDVVVTPSVVTVFIDVLSLLWDTVAAGGKIDFYANMEYRIDLDSRLLNRIDMASDMPDIINLDSRLLNRIDMASDMPDIINLDGKMADSIVFYSKMTEKNQFN